MDTPNHCLPDRSDAAPPSASALADEIAPRQRSSPEGGLGAAIARLVFSSSQDPKQTLRLRRFFAAAGTSLLAIGLLFAGQLQGVISSAAFLQIAAVILLAIVIFYVVFRFRLNLKFPDPSLTEPQMLTATLVVLYAMYSANSGRGAFVTLLLMAFLFGVLRLKARALLLYALFILAAYGAVIVLLWQFKSETLELRLEFLQWLALAITLPWFALMGGYISELRMQLRKSNAQQRHSLEMVKASEANLAEAQRIARLGSWTLDPATGATEWSLATYRIFGVDPAQAPLSGEAFLELIHLEDHHHYNALIRTALREGSRCESQFRIVSRGGGSCWVHAVAEPVVSENGRAALLRGTFMDINERKQLEHRQALEHNVIRVIAESENMDDAMPKIIRMVCETFGWDCGAYWRWDKRDRLLRCSDTWSVNSSDVREFVMLCKQQGLAPMPAGLIRRVWSTGEPVWIADVSREPSFLRASIAAKAGLHGAFAFPIRIGDELCGVLEFFIRNVCQPDAALLRMAQSIGLQIGQFIARTTAQKQIRQLAHFDFLTGLPNRTLFNQLLEHALAKAQRHARQLAILFIDLDGFKQINDRFGHDAGDHLLVTFTMRLRDSLRRSDPVGRGNGSDTAARLGGDEFVVLIDEFANPLELEAVAKRILAAASQPFPLAGPEGQVSASIGISIYPTDGNDIESLTKSADSAMYRAKQVGKNTYRFFSGTMDLRSPVEGQISATESACTSADRLYSRRNA
jgi:diguanylate cyclase (GGDEF)-like protein/PAS domain S-box-containing protein